MGLSETEEPMKRWLILFFAIFLTACAAPVTQAGEANSPVISTTQPAQADYPDLGAAPELAGDSWLNTDAPLRLANLRGKVVLVDMWTFG
jgi:hypothetical protein